MSSSQLNIIYMKTSSVVLACTFIVLLTMERQKSLMTGKFCAAIVHFCFSIHHCVSYFDAIIISAEWNEWMPWAAKIVAVGSLIQTLIQSTPFPPLSWGFGSMGPSRAPPTHCVKCCLGALTSLLFGFFGGLLILTMHVMWCMWYILALFGIWFLLCWNTGFCFDQPFLVIVTVQRWRAVPWHVEPWCFQTLPHCSMRVSVCVHTGVCVCMCLTVLEI